MDFRLIARIRQFAFLFCFRSASWKDWMDRELGLRSVVCVRNVELWGYFLDSECLVVLRNSITSLPVGFRCKSSTNLR